MKQNNQKIRQLNDLLKVNHGAEKSYLEALETTSDAELKKFFRARAFECNEFCRYLGAEVRMLGGKPDYTDLDKKINWPNFGKVIVSENPRALFDEINRLKMLCLAYYNDALTKFSFQENILNLLEKQKQKIGSSISYSRYLDDLFIKKPRSITS